MMRLLSSPMPDLTDDLVEEILARVPAISLKRLRSICKKWSTLFNDRRFTKKHFDKAEKKYLQLMLRNKDRLSWISLNLHGLHDSTNPSPIEFKGELGLNKFYRFEVFHCNGLLLCTNTTTVVWNPCTGQTKWIQTKSSNTSYHEYALGYVNKKSGHDYKILRFLNYQPSELEIFEFNSDSWRVAGSVNPDFILQVGGVSVKGNTYWIANDKADYIGFIIGNDKADYIGFLIGFDFTTERFGPRLCLPFQGHSLLYEMSLYSVREERLSVLFRRRDAVEIWVTNDITETNIMSWNKFLSIDNGFTHQILCSVSFFIDEENKSAMVSEIDLPYYYTEKLVDVIGEDRCRRVNLGDKPWKTQLLSYVPSLVQI